MNPLAFLTGPVQVTFGGDPATSTVADLGKLIDEQAKTVRSDTGEIALDYGKGICTLNTSRAQGVAAFFQNQKTVSLKDVQVVSGNEYGSVLLVSMDVRPLAFSTKVLVQVGTQCRPAGWVQTPLRFHVKEGDFDGFVVNSVGHAPWQVVRADMTITIHNSVLSHATALDMNGNAAGEIPIQKQSGNLRFRFPDSGMYVVLR